MGVNQSTYQELRTRYINAWTPPPTEYPNEAFTKPNPPVMWARFTVTEGAENQMDIGSEQKVFRSFGALVIQIFAPSGAGAVTALAKADEIANAFRNWCGATVTCRSASVRSIGTDPFGWYQINVTVPFKVDSVH